MNICGASKILLSILSLILHLLHRVCIHIGSTLVQLLLQRHLLLSCHAVSCERLLVVLHSFLTRSYIHLLVPLVVVVHASLVVASHVITSINCLVRVLARLVRLGLALIHNIDQRPLSIQLELITCSTNLSPLQSILLLFQHFHLLNHLLSIL
jgi:hypothetical protein